MNSVTSGPIYEPDDDIEIHRQNAIALLCRAFQSHETGLPEWPKNAADEYSRRRTPFEGRVIVVLMRNGRGSRPSMIGCLDFSGMSSAVIEDKFRQWADPEAASAADADVQGGHGNGGKCYMTQMFTEQAYMHTVLDGLGCHYGTVRGSVQFGYFPNREEGRDFQVADLTEELGRALEPVDLTLSDLPAEAQAAFSMGSGFTLVAGFGAKDYGSRLPVTELVNALQDHPQMMMTLETCRVHVLANGRLANSGEPIRLTEIEPMPETEPKTIAIPETLIDPQTGEEVSTTAGGALSAGALTISTSEKSMRWKPRKARHNITYKANGAYIGYRPMVDFDVSSSYKDRMYGTCELDALEPFMQNERAALAVSPLTRGVQAFISEQIEAYAKTFELRDRYSHNRQEKDALAAMNEALDDWKNSVLTEVVDTAWGPGGIVGPPPPPPPLPSGVAARIELGLSHSRAGIGVSLRPTVKFFDKDGNPIRTQAYEWMSSDTNVAMVDESLNIVNTFAEGTTELSVAVRDQSLKSNSVLLEVVPIESITVEPESISVPLGSRSQLRATCHLRSGEIASDVYLIWVEDDGEIAKVSASGLVYGFSIGTTQVYAMDEHVSASGSAAVEIVPNETGGDGPDRSRGFPKILISGVNSDPETGDQVVLSPDDPPVHQRVQDVEQNVWWINSSAPLAKMYLDPDAGFGVESREWRMYHVERFMEAIVQIALAASPTASDQISVGDWIYRWGEQASDVQRAAIAGLRGFIDSGDIEAIG